MRRTIFFCAVLLGIPCLVFSVDTPGIAVIPKPRKIETGSGFFQVTPATVIRWNDAEVAPCTNILNDFLDSFFNFRLKDKKSAKTGKGINLVVDRQFEKEQYQLTITDDAVTIKGSPSGVFYGVQTLLQLMPAEGETVQLPQLEIEDRPRFGYRGAMLDAGRYFFTVGATKRFIDLMAYYKLNVLHWHLTEDGGWRVEIKKYPKLTEIGAWRRGTQTNRSNDAFDRLPHGGYYTQEQIRDIVRYAAERQVTIIPEIDMPGHMLAALAAYPQLSCTGGPFKVLEMWGIQKDILCAGNEEVYRFVEDVLDELIDLFPSEIIHVGGDEAPKDRWKACPKCQAKIKQENLKDVHELQSYYIKRVAAYLESKGRKLIGWEEIMEGGLAPNAMVMSWRGEKGGIEATDMKHEVVMTPTTYLYLDYYQGKPDAEPYNIGGNLPLSKVYGYEPMSDQIPVENRKYVIGVQGNIWMEYIHSESKLDYMAFPRLIALAETGWSEKGKDYENFTGRLQSNLLWLEKMGVNFRIPEPYGLTDTKTSAGSVTVTLTPPVKGAAIWVTLNGDDPMVNGKRYTEPIQIDLAGEPVTLQCIVRLPDGRVSGTYSAVYTRE